MFLIWICGIVIIYLICYFYDFLYISKYASYMYHILYIFEIIVFHIRCVSYLIHVSYLCIIASRSGSIGKKMVCMERSTKQKCVLVLCKTVSISLAAKVNNMRPLSIRKMSSQMEDITRNHHESKSKWICWKDILNC